MKNVMVRLLAAALVLAVTACFPAAARLEEPAKAPEGTAADSVNDFALDLYARLRGEEGNLFFSPHSISTALAMTYAGARGETARQMADVLSFHAEGERLHLGFGELQRSLAAGKEEKGYELTVANALWGQKGYGFLKEFLELTGKHYGAGLREMDFRGAAEDARKTINSWVEEKTRDRIKDLIKPGVLNSMTRLVLTNAIYFKGDWARQFDEKATRDAPFWLTQEKKADVPMMFHRARFKYAEMDSLQCLELPYVGEELSMVVLLPKERTGLGKLEASLNRENLERWVGRMHRMKVSVHLPKFKLTRQFQLGGTLKAMGMTDAFSDRADFSGMNGKRDLFISAVIHKAFVEVNEEGTEAAAATAVVIQVTSIQPETVFRADHPFIFLIRDTRSGAILFMGRVSDPGVGAE